MCGILNWLSGDKSIISFSWEGPASSVFCLSSVGGNLHTKETKKGGEVRSPCSSRLFSPPYVSNPILGKILRLQRNAITSLRPRCCVLTIRCKVSDAQFKGTFQVQDLGMGLLQGEVGCPRAGDEGGMAADPSHRTFFLHR